MLCSQLPLVQHCQAGKGGAPRLRFAAARLRGRFTGRLPAWASKQAQRLSANSPTATVGMLRPAGRQAQHSPVNSPTASVGKANDLAPSGLNRRLQGNCQ